MAANFVRGGGQVLYAGLGAGAGNFIGGEVGKGAGAESLVATFVEHSSQFGMNSSITSLLTFGQKRRIDPLSRLPLESDT